MADSSAHGAPALSTNVPSGHFDDEKAAYKAPTPAKKVEEEEEEEDEDIDALIEDLESQDGHVDVSLFPHFASIALGMLGHPGMHFKRLC